MHLVYTTAFLTKADLHLDAENVKADCSLYPAGCLASDRFLRDSAVT